MEFEEAQKGTTINLSLHFIVFRISLRVEGTINESVMS